MIRLAPAEPSHVNRIANNMREDDRIECQALGRTPKQALRQGLRNSTFALTALYDDEPAAMFGVAPGNAIEGVGRPWFLGTEQVFGCAKPLLIMAAPIMAEMHRHFRRLENIVSCRNRRAIRMLGRWGFELGGEAMTIGGVEFVPFWREG